MRTTAGCFLLCSCMKALHHPLLELQLKDSDTLLVSPLRDFATEILVFSHCSPQENTATSDLKVISWCVWCAGHPGGHQRAPPQPGVPASAEEETASRLPGGGGAVSQRLAGLLGSPHLCPSPGCRLLSQCVQVGTVEHCSVVGKGSITPHQFSNKEEQLFFRINRD